MTRLYPVELLSVSPLDREVTAESRLSDEPEGTESEAPG
jgi:hypothetical protein